MSTILDTIAAATRARVAGLKTREPLESLEARAAAARPVRPFLEAFAGPGPAHRIIAEVKLASPSEGDIMPDADPVQVAGDYLSNGASALSVLTEPSYFKGDISYLIAIRKAHAGARVLMKDFVVDEYQLFQGRAAGADAALILLAMLSPAEAHRLFKRAVALGLTPLVEVHDEAELSLAADLGAKLIGVNNRNLKTMQVSLDASERLAAAAPKDAVLVSESGIKTPDDLKRLTELGYRGFLIGTHFMRTGQPGAALAALLKGAR